MNLVCADCGRRPDDCICEALEAEHQKYSVDELKIAHTAMDAVQMALFAAQHVIDDWDINNATNALKHLAWHIDEAVKRSETLNIDLKGFEL